MPQCRNIFLAASVLTYLTGCNLEGSVSTEKDFSGHIIERNYGSFLSVVDCDSRLALVEYAEVKSGKIDHPRYKSFFLDKKIEGCSQTSSKTYSTKLSGVAYHRGHLISSDALDDSAERIRSTNVMTNIVPQLATNNRSGGAWYEIEDQIRCVRKKTHTETIKLIVGTLDDGNVQDDFFLSSHSVATPDDLFKIAFFPNGELRSWIVSNTAVSKAKDVHSLMVSPDDIMDRMQSDYAKQFLLEHLPPNYLEHLTFKPIHCT